MALNNERHVYSDEWKGKGSILKGVKITFSNNLIFTSVSLFN